eukprot:UN32400
MGRNYVFLQKFKGKLKWQLKDLCSAVEALTYAEQANDIQLPVSVSLYILRFVGYFGRKRVYGKYEIGRFTLHIRRSHSWSLSDTENPNGPSIYL